MLCWAAKWHGADEIMFDSVHRSKPKDMLKRIHKLIDEADAVVHYNGKSFDMPTLNKEFLMHKMAPPAPYKQIDLCLVAKSEFRFPSNKLDYITKALKIGQKVGNEGGHQLWIDCMAGKAKAWQKMRTYNIHDVELLEQVYDRMRPWIRVHPNVGLYDQRAMVCPACGSNRLQKAGVSRTLVQQYTRYRCLDCGKWSRNAEGQIEAKTRRNIMRPVND